METSSRGLRYGRPVRPSGQVDQTQIAATVDNFQYQAGYPQRTDLVPLGLDSNSPFSQVGRSWLQNPNPDLLRQLLAAVGVFNTTADYQEALAREITDRLRRITVTGPDLHLTTEQWCSKSFAQKHELIRTFFRRQNNSYLYIRPSDYDEFVRQIDQTCSAAPSNPVSGDVLPTIVRVTVSASAVLPNDLTVTLGDIQLRRTGPNTFETDDLPTEGPTAFPGAHALLVITAAGLSRQEQRVDIAPHATTDVAVRLARPAFGMVTGPFVPPTPQTPPTPPSPPTCATPPAFSNEPDRQEWIHANPGCTAPPANCPAAPTSWATEADRTAWVAAHSACPPPTPYCPPLPASFASEAERQLWIDAHSTCTAPTPWCPPPPTSWAVEADRTAWIAAHSTCLEPPPYCPPLPASFASEADRQTWITAHAGCTAPGPYCPPPPTAWSTAQERTDWIAAHANCPEPGPYCPALPASFTSAEDRQAWIDAHSGCTAPVWTAPVVAPVTAPAKKSSGWKWLLGLAVVAGGGYALKKRNEKAR